MVQVEWKQPNNRGFLDEDTDTNCSNMHIYFSDGV